MVPNSNGHQRRLPSKQHSKIIEFPPTTGGNQGPCRDAGVGEIAPGFAMLKRANALHTLIRQRHLTPLCGGHAPTAERTMNPARMFLESLDRRPGIREQPGSKADLGTLLDLGRLISRKQTLQRSVQRSASGKNRTHSPQQTTELFDHLVGTSKQRPRHGKTERLGGFEVDSEFETGGASARSCPRPSSAE
jgi:hypothetical protein